MTPDKPPLPWVDRHGVLAMCLRVVIVVAVTLLTFLLAALAVGPLQAALQVGSLQGHFDLFERLMISALVCGVVFGVTAASQVGRGQQDAGLRWGLGIGAGVISLLGGVACIALLAQL